MEKSKGRVRNYVVSNKDMFCDYLARALCKMQIGYVQVDNEFHFNDRIYRFYNFDECLELNGQVVFVSLDKDKLVSLSPQDLLFTRSADDLSRFLDPMQDVVARAEDVTFEDKKPKQKVNTRQAMLRDNKMTKQRIKNSYKPQGFRNRRNG